MAVDRCGNPRISGGQRAGAACDHWSRYREDIGLMKALGLNAYRFSVEWSKIEPAPGQVDHSALGHYRQVVAALKSNGIEPVVTLHHFTNPLWFEDRGAFLSDSSPQIFGRYVARVAEALGTEVGYWCTINEPTVYAINGYVTGEFPPAEHDVRKAIRVMRNMLRAHSEAFSVLKGFNPAARVGLATNIFVLEPASRWNPVDHFVAASADRNLHRSILRYLIDGEFDFHVPGLVHERFSGPRIDTHDFVGLNYYTRFRVTVRPFSPRKIVALPSLSGHETTDMGWEIYPEGMKRALDLVRSVTSKPVYITENGLADDSDTKRGRFIRDHLSQVADAVVAGIDVRGYFFWSLLDNFEWAYGYQKRFGLYRVDFSTQKRTLREGSRAYPEMIRQYSPVP